MLLPCLRCDVATAGPGSQRSPSLGMAWWCPDGYLRWICRFSAAVNLLETVELDDYEEWNLHLIWRQEPSHDAPARPGECAAAVAVLSCCR